MVFKRTAKRGAVPSKDFAKKGNANQTTVYDVVLKILERFNELQPIARAMSNVNDNPFKELSNNQKIFSSFVLFLKNISLERQLSPPENDALFLALIGVYYATHSSNPKDHNNYEAPQHHHPYTDRMLYGVIERDRLRKVLEARESKRLSDDDNEALESVFRSKADPKEIGKQIRLMREAKGWTQQELGKRIGIDQSTIASIEGGRSKQNQSTLQRLVNVFQEPLTIDYIPET